MDNSTKQMLVTVGAGAARKVLMLQAAGLVSHGVINSNMTETYVSLGMAAVGALWSFWNDFGRSIVIAQLTVLKAKSLAQAAALEKHDIPSPTPTQIADHSETLTAKDVTKVETKL